MINLHDPADIAARRPILIAHRGGVIAPGAPENSQRAIELAAQQGYDLVELDICCAADHVPVLFHGHGGRGGMGWRSIVASRATSATFPAQS